MHNEPLLKLTDSISTKHSARVLWVWEIMLLLIAVVNCTLKAAEA